MRDSVAVIIFNHALNEQAISLKKQFEGKELVFLFDSGSEITAEQRPHFNKSFPNIYYNGLLNETNEFLKKHDYEIGIIITSDVEIEDVDDFLLKTKAAFKSENVGVYAPSADYSYHRHMIHKPGAGLKEVTFTEGFCFAFRTKILDELCPIDTTINKYGYGAVNMLCYHALQKGYKNCVDHRIKVIHPFGSGYDKHAGVRAKWAWIASLPKREQHFYKLTAKTLLKNQFGLLLTKWLFGFDG